MTERTRYVSEGGPIRVLHIDDDACFLKTAKAVLEMQGTFQVETAASVEEAAEKMKKEEYDVVVSDYQMPGKDGLQFLKELREKGNSVPFIVFTGRGREEVAIEALNLSADGYFNKSGHPETVYGELAHGMRQIVDKRRAEQSFLKSENKYRRLVETLHEGIWAVGKDSRTTFVNPRMAEILGYDIEEMKGRHLFSFMDERHVEIAKRFLERRQQGIKEQHDFEFLRKDGTRIYTTLETSPITDDNGNYIGALASVMDITERKKAEEALLAERDRLEIVTESIDAGLAVISEDYRILWANKVLKRIFGDVEGKICYSTYHRRSEICPRCGVREVFEAEKDRAVHEEVGKDVAGKIIWLEIIASPIKDKSGKATAAVELVVPVTERRKAEEEIERSERKYRSLVEQSLQGIAVTQGPAPHLVFANATMSRILGYTPDELTSLSPQETMGLVHPEDRNVFFGRFKDRLNGKTALSHYEFRGIRKDGTVVWLDQSASRIEYNGHPAVQTTFIDITENKKTLERLRVLNEKLGVVGKLTRHDVRNKLSAVIGNIYLTKKTLPNDHKAIAYLNEIELACIATTRVLDFAAAYESLGVEELTLMDVAKAVEEAVSLVSELKGVKVVNNCQGLTVMADSALRQLFFNLIENSLKHGKNVSQIKIHYEEGKDRLRLFYEDNGVGILKANKPKLFNVGFTTGNGLGYGLSLIKSMMEIYGWTIEEEGEPGKRAKFVITIPKTHITMCARNTYP